jgi:hypothetical protein
LTAHGFCAQADLLEESALTASATMKIAVFIAANLHPAALLTQPKLPPTQRGK